MQILYFGAFKYPIGEAACAHIRRAGIGLREAGASVRILTMGTDLTQGWDKASRPSFIDEIPYQCCLKKRPVGARAKIKAAISAILKARRLLDEAAKQGTIDVLILYTPSCLDYLCIAGLRSMRRVKIVSNRLEWFEPEVFHGGRLNPFYLIDKIGRLWDQKTDGIIAISKFIQEQYPKTLPTIRVPSAFDFSDSTYSPPQQTTSSDLTLLYAGELKPNDGMDEVLEGLQRVRAAGLQWKLNVVGPNPQGPGAVRLTQFCAANTHLRGAVTFLGRVPDADYMRHLASATALILLRKNDVRSRASFPTRLPEFLSTGRPVITSDVPDIPLYLTDRVHAHVLPVARPDLIAERLGEIARDPALAQAMGERGRQRATQCFNCRVEGRRMFEFLKMVQSPGGSKQQCLKSS